MKPTLISLAKVCLFLSLICVINPFLKAQSEGNRTFHTCGVSAVIDELRSSAPEKYAKGLKKYHKKIQYSNKSVNSLEGCPSGITVIPIAFHVFHPDQKIGTGYNFSKSDLIKLIDHLNADFSGYNNEKAIISNDFIGLEAGHTCIQFSLGKINRIATTDCPNWTIGATHSSLHHCLPGGSGPGSLNDPNDYLNIYITDLNSGVLGIASNIPYIYGNPNGPEDGITIDWKVAIPGNKSSAYNRGAVVSHEVGHWLGLPHVNGDIEGYSCQADDGFSDTYPQLNQQFYRCADTDIPTSCNSFDNVFNFMDYAIDCAKLQFTKQQSAAMNKVLEEVRSSLRTSYQRNFDRIDHGLRLCIEAPEDAFKYKQSNANCSAEINLLKIQNEWFPSMYQDHSSQSGYNVFTWKRSTSSDPDLKKVEYPAEVTTIHDGQKSNAHTFLYLYHKCWNPFTKSYTKEMPVGMYIQTLQACEEPQNNIPEEAITLELGYQCVPTKYTLQNATSSGDNVNCGEFLELPDVWFMAKAPSVGRLAYEISGTHHAPAPALEIYTVSSSGNLNCLDKSHNSKGRVDGLMPGEPIYFRVVRQESSIPNEFLLCAKIPAVDNNICEEALDLAVMGECKKVMLNNSLATASGVPRYGAICGSSDTGVDMWYRVTIPQSGNVYLETFQVDGGISEIVLEAYAGSCDNLTAISCGGAKARGAKNDKHAYLEVLNRTPGEVVYIRMLSNGAVPKGDFEICVSENRLYNSCRINLIEGIVESRCDDPSNPYKYQLIVHHNGNDDTNKKIEINGNQYTLTSNPQVLDLTNKDAQSIKVQLRAQLVDDNDVSCKTDSYYEASDVLASPEPCHRAVQLTFDECEGAIPLPVNENCQGQIYNNHSATYSVQFDEEYRCGMSGKRPKDVWFKAVIPESGEIVINAPLLFNGNNMILEAYIGSCAPESYIACDQFGGAMGSEISLTERTPGEILYIRVADQGNNSLGEFSICAFDPASNSHKESKAANKNKTRDWYFDKETQTIIRKRDTASNDYKWSSEPASALITSK